ncbi:MAG: putative manganese-dependent inorganic diphosphatase [Bacillota bacterium]
MSDSVYIIGHKNPDTDSICSSIAYSYLKNAASRTNSYIPKKIGDINGETRYVLDYFNVEEPSLIEDVKTQIRDIAIKRVSPVNPGISLKKAWGIMKSNNITTLMVSEDGKSLSGIITVGDIAESYMDIYDNSILSAARTPYKNILEVLEGNLIVGDIDDSIYNGQVLIGAMNPEVMESYIKPKDIVILGNRYETQLCAIEMGAQCLIVTGGIPVAASIKKLAENHNCAIIISPYDTYKVARFINQSLPIGYFMKTSNLTTFSIDDYIDEIKEVMVKKRYRNFPVIDTDGSIAGLISRASLINLQRKKVILVDHNERAQAVEGLEEADLLEIIDHHRIGDIETTGPVYFRNQPLGCTATIIANMFKENYVELPSKIAGILCAAILSDTLMFKSPTCTDIDAKTAEHLAATAGINMQEFARAMFRAGSDLINKSDEELLYQDFKIFKAGELKLAVGQINSMDSKELQDIKDRLLQYMKRLYSDKYKDVDLLMCMLTDIANESTELLFVGNRTDVIIAAFGTAINSNSVLLPGVVSRKKQVIPPILNCINE